MKGIVPTHIHFTRLCINSAHLQKDCSYNVNHNFTLSLFDELSIKDLLGDSDDSVITMDFVKT